LLMGLLARAPIFLLGPPGTAKSNLVRDLCGRIGNGELPFFDWLLTKFSTPEELFGPVSMKGLENDHFVRVTQGKLPEARVAFVDETFKASAGILNALLTLLNERKFHNNGKPQDTPWELFVGASNETPQDPALAALYDRFILRYMTVPIQGQKDFVDMITTSAETAPGSAVIDIKGLGEARELMPHVEISQGILDGMLEIRARLIAGGFKPSDRRWKRSMTVVRARAVLYERDKAIKEDLSVLAHVMWNTPDERAKVERLVAEVANPLAAQALDYMDTIREIEQNTLYRDDGSLNPTPDPRGGTEANAKLKHLVDEMLQIIEKEKAAGSDVAKLQMAVEEGREANRRVVEIAMGTDLTAFREYREAQDNPQPNP